MTKDEKREYDRVRYERIRADPALNEKRKAQVRKAAKDYYHRNPQLGAAKTAEWRARNPEKRDAQKRRWAAKYRNERCARAKREYWADPAKSQAASRAWYAANRDHAAARSREWARNNPERKTQYENTRRARKLKAGETHTLAEWRALLAVYGGACAYCGGTNRITRDHKVPLARGGSDDIANIVPACKSCNSKKSTLSVEEFLKRRAA